MGVCGAGGPKQSQQNKTIKQTGFAFSMTDFDLTQTLAQGQFGNVQIAIHKQSKMEEAMKTLEKYHFDDRQRENFQKELDNLPSIDHPFLLKTYKTYQDDKAFYTFTELVKGGSLDKYIITKNTLLEREACSFLYQILTGLLYLHNHNIAFRDVKPECIVFESLNRDILKLLHFGKRAYFSINKEEVSKTLFNPGLTWEENISLKEYTEIWDI